MTLDDFVKDAWRDHADDAQGVAERLRASLDLIQRAEDFAPYVRLVTHVFGEHLMQLEPGLALLQSMRTLPAFDGSDAASKPLVRAIATLQLVGQVPTALEGLDNEDRVCALTVASVIYQAHNDIDLAADALQRALDAVQPGWPDASPAHRALAVAGNNLAAALEEKADRTPLQTQDMVVAAQTGLTYWKLAGTWLEEERAEYRLTRCLLQAADAQLALEHAQRCLTVCQGNDAPAFELFFAQAVLALACRAVGDTTAFAAHREAALQSYGQVPEDDQVWCSQELGELG
jgi:tetratricopeptide (TPR) repeat protein